MDTHTRTRARTHCLIYIYRLPTNLNSPIVGVDPATPDLILSYRYLHLSGRVEHGRVYLQRLPQPAPQPPPEPHQGALARPVVALQRKAACGGKGGT